MDPSPPANKRPRLSSWPVAPQPPGQGVALPQPHPHPPHPHSHPHHAHPGQQLPPPPPPPPHAPHPGVLQHHPAPSPYQSYPPAHPHHPPPRPADQSSAPPTPVSASVPALPHPDADRRHHEQEPYAPVQDHYRQQQQQQPPPPPPQHQQQPPHPPQHAPGSHQPSPHTPYQPYPPREPTIKRDPAEDPRRPSSTGHAPDGLPSTPHLAHSSHPPPAPAGAYQESQPRNMSYDHTASVPPTPGGYRAPSYPPPTPVSAQPPYDQHGGYGNPGDAFYSVYSSSVPPKKKNTRASQACDSCRQLKAKCDETKPCKTCKEKGVECKYRDPVPKATDKAQADILDGLTNVQNTLSNLMDHFGRFDQRLLKMESRLPKTDQPAGLRTPARAALSEPMPAPASAAVHERVSEPLQAPMASAMPAPLPAPLDTKSDNVVHEDYRPVPTASPSPMVLNGSSSEGAYSHGTPLEREPEHQPLRMMAEDELEAEPGPPVAPGEPAIPIGHTTPAGLMLDWPPIRELVRHHLDREGVRFVTEYPISQEQNRGVLIVYGRGEDSHTSRHAREQADHGTLEMGDDSSDMASPSPAADWGQLGGLSPPDQVEYRGGVLGFDGNPDFTESKVWMYVESFKEHILNMHPIIQPKVLDYWVRHFLDSLPASQPKSAKLQTAKPTFAVGGTPTETTGNKRKRSPGPDGSEPPTPAQVRGGRPDRSIHSALVLTVLALGKICLHRDSVPDVVHPPEQQPVPHGSPSVRNGMIPPSPNQGSPPGMSSHSHSSGLPSPKEQDRSMHSRRSSIHGSGGYRSSGYSLKKNYEVIPGLEYFAYATDILGNQLGTYNNMKNVYANIFAGLYHGQLGRPLESFAYIHQAGHKLQVIMRPSLDKLKRIKHNSEFIHDTKYNQLALTFWTLLQLESDLIAELPLPPSGLLSYEEDMPPPHMGILEGFNQRVLDSYLGQLYLRKHLNSIHRMFYKPNDATTPESDEFRNVGLVADAVSSMRWVARSFAFSEEDPPADDILSARLRAKYWGAQVITYRPFIRQILQFSYTMRNPAASPQFPNVGTEFRDGVIAPMIHPDAKSHNEINTEVVELARKGIKALVESTRSFHGLGDRRPIITNVFGTAHAQWGNLLVLSAAYRDPVLHPYVDEEMLRSLFHRTITFLRQSAAATSSLRIDMHILEGLQRDLFMNLPDPRTGSSFSSGTSVAGYHTPRPAPMGAPAPPPPPMSSMNDPGAPRPVATHIP